jgi:hypothetical protein
VNFTPALRLRTSTTHCAWRASCRAPHAFAKSRPALPAVVRCGILARQREPHHRRCGLAPGREQRR